MRSVVTLLFYILASFAIVAAGNLHLNTQGDVRRAIDLGVFGFTSNGVVQIKIPEFFIDDPRFFVDANGKLHNDEPIGFTLDLIASAQAARIEKNYAKGDGADHRLCFIDDPLLKPVERVKFSLASLTPQEISEKTFESKVTVPGLYALFFFNCKGFHAGNQSYIKPVPVSFSIEATMYNIGSDGAKHYLTATDTNMPVLYALFGVVFFVIAIVWIRLMQANMDHVTRVHRVMLFLLLIKGLSLLLETAKLHHYDQSGHPSIWDWFYYIALGVKGCTLFGVLLLLGTGWSVMKQFLSDHDRKIFLIILPGQFLVNLSLAIIEETSEGSKHWSQWSDVLHIVDVVCCCCVLLPVVWSMKNLRDTAADDDKAAQSLARMRKFRTFYIVIVAYIYGTRIILPMIESSLPWNLTWIVKVGREVVAVVFYVYTGYTFQPKKETAYGVLDRRDEEELEERREVAV